MSILIFFISLSLFSQGDRFKKGKIIDTIWVDKSKHESFAFYMPKSYEPSKPAPVIFIFEPMARGKTGIDPFIAASETYGYLLICSNNSKNGPFEHNYEIANRLFDKVFSSLLLDPKRIYTSGFSGGGRLALSIAVKTNQIQGVVSCGASLTVNSPSLPTNSSLSYAMIMGEEDMNYYELTFTRKYLSRTQISHEVFIPAIDHRWPDQDQMLLAFDWMQLEAYKKLLLPVDSMVIKSIYTKFYRQAKRKEKEHRLLSSANEYKRILQNFKRYYQLDSIENDLHQLTQSKAYRSQQKEHTSLLESETMQTEELFDRFSIDMNKATYQMGWWQNRIEKLQKKVNSDSHLEQIMYKRLLYKLFAHAIETAGYEGSALSITQKMFCYDVCIEVYPSYGYPYIKQIESCVRLEKPEAALDYLERLLESGFDKKELLLNNESVKSLEEHERFQKLMFP